MSDSLIVMAKIAAMFLVMAVGWLARRRALLDAPTTTVFSRFTTDIAFPALIVVQLLDHVNRRALRESWATPLMCVLVLLAGQLVGWAFWRLFATRRQAPTFIFVVAIANWIYLPLPIVEALYGGDGVRQLLLCNIGAQLLLWTLGVATLHGGRLDRQAMGNLFRNAGLLATLLGIVLILLRPERTEGGQASAVVSLWLGSMGNVLMEAMRIVGSLTVPLSLVVTGAQLAALPLRGPRPTRALAGVLLLRLGVVPLLLVGLAWAAGQLGWSLPSTAVMIGLIIAAMPVAISCSIMTERFGQDTALAAQSILYTTLGSLVTVPLIYTLARRVVEGK